MAEQHGSIRQSAAAPPRPLPNPYHPMFDASALNKSLGNKLNMSQAPRFSMGLTPQSQPTPINSSFQMPALPKLPPSSLLNLTQPVLQNQSNQPSTPKTALPVH